MFPLKNKPSFQVHSVSVSLDLCQILEHIQSGPVDPRPDETGLISDNAKTPFQRGRPRYLSFIIHERACSLKSGSMVRLATF